MTPQDQTYLYSVTNPTQEKFDENTQVGFACGMASKVIQGFLGCGGGHSTR